MSDSTGPSLVLYAVGLVMLFFAAYASAQRRVAAAPEFALLMASASLYAFGYGYELSQTSLEGIMQVIRFEYLGIAAIPAFWLLSSLRLSRPTKPGPILIAVIFLLPIAVVTAVWTNGQHHLFYARAWVRTDGPFPVIGFDRGPLYWLSIINIQACIVLGSAILIAHALKSSQLVRRRAITAAIGSLGPWLGNGLYILGWTPWGLEPSSFFMVLAGIAFYISIFHLGLLELVPAARDRAIEALRDGFLVLDRRGRLVDANQAAGRLLGSWATRIGYPLERGLPGGEALGRILDAGEAQTEFSLGEASGGERRLEAYAFPVGRGRRSREGSAIIVRDVTENSALLARLSLLAGTDELTGLHNRRRFYEDGHRALSQAQREGRQLAVAILDIDHFKSVNDRFGHAAGDAALKLFAERLLQDLRSADFLCRYGGEEFAIILPGAEPEVALATIERLRLRSTAQGIPWEGGEFAIRASAGIYAAVPTEAESLDDFVSAADSALYQAKDGGRDRTVLGREAARAPSA